MEYENNFDEVGENYLKEDGCKVDEEQIKEKFDNIHEKIINHDERITKIEMGMVQQQESLKYVIKNQEELNDSINILNTNSMQNYNAMLTGLNSLIINKQDNETKITNNKNTNKTNIIIQVMIGLTAIGGALIAIIK